MTKAPIATLAYDPAPYRSGPEHAVAHRAPTRHYNERTARLRALRDEVAKQVNEAMDIGPSSSPPLMPDA